MNKNSKIIIGILIAEAVLFGYGVLFYEWECNVISGYSLEPPTLQHWFGTDNLGVDLFSQVSMGYFNSMAVALAAVSVTFVLGGIMGVLSGYFQGPVDDGISFLINIFLSVPQLPVMIVIGAFFGQSLWNVVIIVAMFSWAGIAKVVRAKTLSIRKRGYITQAKLYGASFRYLFRVHMKQEIMPILVINSVGVIGKAVIQEADLAFLGLCDPTSRSWGLMINKVLDFPNIYYTDYWKWWLMGPLISLVFTIILFRALVRELEKTWLGESDRKKNGGKLYE